MKYSKLSLPNKLRLIYVPMPSVESSTATVWVRTGSRFEGKDVNGISHFLEHMVFKGSKKRPSAKRISEAVDGLGGEFNAGTSKEWTNFYIKARSGVMDEAFDILSDMVLQPLLKKDALEREKGVILEEMAMYEDTPVAKIGDLFENLIYKDSSLGWDVIGTRKSIKNMKRNDFVRYRKGYYYPENMLVTVAGSVKQQDIVKLVKKYFKSFPSKSQKQEKPKIKFVQTRPNLILKSKKTDQAHLILGFRGDAMGSKRRYAEGLLATILGSGMSSRMFTQVREKRGLAYAVKTSSDHAIDNGYLATYAGVRLDSISEAIKVMLNEYYSLSQKKKPISKKEFSKAKEYIKGNLALSLEDTKDVNAFFGVEELYLGKARTPDEVYKSIDKVRVGEVYDVAKDFFKPEKLNLSIIGPFKERSRFEKIIGA
jgi:predicted Zn-dependent peptidase